MRGNTYIGWIAECVGWNEQEEKREVEKRGKEKEREGATLPGALLSIFKRAHTAVSPKLRTPSASWRPWNFYSLLGEEKWKNEREKRLRLKETRRRKSWKRRGESVEQTCTQESRRIHENEERKSTGVAGGTERICAATPEMAGRAQKNQASFFSSFYRC